MTLASVELADPARLPLTTIVRHRDDDRASLKRESVCERVREREGEGERERRLFQF